jgi:hypothetical protein
MYNIKRITLGYYNSLNSDEQNLLKNIIRSVYTRAAKDNSSMLSRTIVCRELNISVYVLQKDQEINQMLKDIYAKS